MRKVECNCVSTAKLAKRNLLLACSGVVIATSLLLGGCAKSNKKEQDAASIPVEEETIITEKETSPEYATVESLNESFINDSGYVLKAAENAEDNTIIYSYEVVKEEADKDVFAKFLGNLLANGYTMKYEIMDASGYRSGYELDRNGHTLVVSTISNENEVTLKVQDMDNSTE